MTKSIARGFKKALVDQCFNDVETFKYVITKLNIILTSEIKSMCSEKSTLCFREDLTMN